MGLFLRQDENRSELQSRIATELQQKLRDKPDIEQDAVEPRFLENQHETRTAGVVISLLIAALVITVIFVIFTSKN